MKLKDIPEQHCIMEGILYHAVCNEWYDVPYNRKRQLHSR